MTSELLGYFKVWILLKSRRLFGANIGLYAIALAEHVGAGRRSRKNASFPFETGRGCESPIGSGEAAFQIDCLAWIPSLPSDPWIP